MIIRQETVFIVGIEKILQDNPGAPAIQENMMVAEDHDMAVFLQFAQGDPEGDPG